MSLERAASTSAMSAASAMFRDRARRSSSRKNGSSMEKLVRWPRIVTERFFGPVMASMNLF